jgi:hypothetical protein
MASHKEEVPRMKETSRLERDMKSILTNSFDSGEATRQLLKLVNEEREAMLFEIGTFVLSPRDASYSSQVNYIQGMRTRIKS